MQKVLILLAALVVFLAASKPAATVTMNGSTYTPETITIAEGQSVEFINDDDLPHTVTATDKSFDSGNLDARHSWTYTFKKAGTFVYGCTYHAWMHGTIKVLPLAKNGATSGSRFDFANDLARNVRL
jgi:plastocyanin